MSGVGVGIIIALVSVLGVFLFPTLSWALGRWYQGRLVRALNEQEKRTGNMLQSEHYLSTSSSMNAIGANGSTLLHVSICVGPSMGQMFFMWFKSLVGGRLASYDTVLDFGRREVLLRLKKQADEFGCSTIENIRIETSVISFAKNQKSKTSSVEFLAFATGIRQ